MKAKRYNFDRIIKGEVMESGIAVHACSMEEAEKTARRDEDQVNHRLNVRRVRCERETELRFRDNEPCRKASGGTRYCGICHPSNEQGEGS